MSEPYKTLQSCASAIYEEKRSRFIAELIPVTHKDDGTLRLHELRAEHRHARHICWAYFVVDAAGSQSAGFHDDGEPSGTAGKPILNVLMQRRVINVMAFVVRYFGGIKLGAGGLARAYGQATSAAVDCAQLIDIVPLQSLTITVDFANEERVRHCLMQHGIAAVQADYGLTVTLSCSCPVAVIEQIINEVTARTSGAAICRTQ